MLINYNFFFNIRARKTRGLTLYNSGKNTSKKPIDNQIHNLMIYVKKQSSIIRVNTSTNVRVANTNRV